PAGEAIRIDNRKASPSDGSRSGRAGGGHRAGAAGPVSGCEPAPETVRQEGQRDDGEESRVSPRARTARNRPGRPGAADGPCEYGGSLAGPGNTGLAREVGPGPR